MDFRTPPLEDTGVLLSTPKVYDTLLLRNAKVALEGFTVDLLFCKRYCFIVRDEEEST